VALGGPQSYNTNGSVRCRQHGWYAETLTKLASEAAVKWVQNIRTISGLTFVHSLSFVLSNSRFLVQIWFSDLISIAGEGNFKAHISSEIRPKNE